VALDEAGKPSFNALQNYGSSQTPIIFYLFDVMVLAGHDLCAETLEQRRQLLEEKILPHLADDSIRPSPVLPGTLDELIYAVRARVSKAWSPNGETAATKPEFVRAHGRRCA
jgi:ATP-dependent DNA ligase